MSAVRFRLIVSTIHAALLSFLVLLLVASSSVAQTIEGKFYEYKIMSVTGQTPLNANSPLSGMSGPSINQGGVVAFAAGFNSGGQGVVAASPTLSPTVISFANPAPGHLFGQSVQINSVGAVLAQDNDSGDDFDRLWYATKPGSSKTLVKGARGRSYSAVSPNGSVNSSGNAVVPALNQSGNEIILSIQGIDVVGQLSLQPNSFPFPQIADTGTILVRLGQSANSPIYLYNETLTTPLADVADSNCFSIIGNAPGMSADGLVVAFYGAPSGSASCPAQVAAQLGGTTPGIFAYVNTGTGWSYVRVTGFPAELGYDDNSNPLSFSSYSNSRVAVVNLGLAPVPPCSGTGISGNSFVISFIGTPSGASRTNPVLGNIPLLFSSQQGLWTIRVDAGCDLASPSTVVFHPRSAIPAVQVNDNIGSYVISSIDVFNQLANAAEDDAGVIRTMRRGDHRVVFWAQTTTGQQLIVRGSHLDSDQDGLLDHWETSGIDMNQDGIIDLDLPAMGADPNKRDLFLQIDWLYDPLDQFQPLPGVINPAPGQLLFCGAAGTLPVSPLEYMFCQAPALAGNMYGLLSNGKTPAEIPEGITLHIDGGAGMDKSGQPFSVNMGAGPLAGGRSISANGEQPEVLYFGKPNSITAPPVTTLAFQTAKDKNFGLNDNDGRELAFHYAIFSDYFGFETDTAGNTSWVVLTSSSNTLTSLSALPKATKSGDVVKIVAGTGEGEYGLINGVDLSTNTLTLHQDWVTIPDVSSTFVILNGSNGIAEVFFNPTPDNNSLPGNDLIVALGEMGIAGYETNGILGTPCYQWRVLAHELGHNLGLRHGGTDQNAEKGSNYLSLMSYTWVDVCTQVSPVQSYSVATDPTFDDWGNLQPDVSGIEFFLGNSLTLCYTGQCDGQQAPELTGLDYLNQNGPPAAPPVIQIQKPAANANVGLTLPLQVTLNVTDSAQVASVTVAFDVNGNGNTNDPGEKVLAKLTSGTTYQANFAALSGPTGPRKITASAIDGTGNYATATETVNVVEPNPVPSLISLSPSSAIHGGAGFKLTVNGSNFVSGAVGEWNGAARSTTFVNSGQVTMKISAAEIAASGTAQVIVKNPGPGGGTSNALTFTIN